MKVLFLTGSLNQGGAEFQILALAKLFKDNGNKVEVLALTDYSFYKNYLTENDIPYSCFANNVPKYKRVLLTSAKIKKTRPDLIVAYLRVVGLVAILAKLLSLRKIPILVGERTSLTIPGYDTFYFNLMRLTSYLTVNSISKYDYIKQKFPFLLPKLYFTPNIIDLNRFQVMNSNSEITRITYIGRISSEKNILRLIEAIKLIIKQYPKIELRLYGDTRDSEYLNLVKEKILELSLENAVFLRGKINDTIKVYHASDLLCLISDYEGFSNVISEALCCGIPILASDIPENQFLVENKKNGFLVDHKDVKSIAHGLRTFLDLPKDEVTAIKLLNRKKAEEIFDIKKLYSQYLHILNSKRGTNH